MKTIKELEQGCGRKGDGDMDDIDLICGKQKGFLDNGYCLTCNLKLETLKEVLEIIEKCISLSTEKLGKEIEWVNKEELKQRITEGDQNG